MTSDGTAIVDYSFHFISLTYEAYGKPDLVKFAAELPEAAKALPEKDIAGIFGSGSWGMFEGFKEALPAA